jgi:hypothetical protein
MDFLINDFGSNFAHTAKIQLSIIQRISIVSQTKFLMWDTRINAVSY